MIGNSLNNVFDSMISSSTLPLVLGVPTSSPSSSSLFLWRVSSTPTTGSSGHSSPDAAAADCSDGLVDDGPCYRDWSSAAASTLAGDGSGDISDPTATKMASDFVEYHVANWLWICVPPALLLFGTFGNVLSLAVLRGCTSFRKSSVGFTLSALAVVDTGVLYVSLLRQWILYMTGYTFDVRWIGGTGGCKLHFFLSYFLSHLSSWTVVVVTIERTVVVGMPIVAKIVCSRSRVIVLWSTICSILFLLNAHFFITAHYPIIVKLPIASQSDVTQELSDLLDVSYQFGNSTSADAGDAFTSGTTSPEVGTASASLVPIQMTCHVSDQYDWFLRDVWYWIDFTTLSAVPFLLVATGNFVIGVCVVRAVQFRRHCQRHEFGNGGGGAHEMMTTSGGTFERQRERRSNTSGSGADKYSAAMTSSTLMLMSVSITFLLTTVPNVVYFLKVDEWLADVDRDPHGAGKQREARVHLVYAVTNLLYYVNNSVNFLLYCLTGSRFRRAARELFSRSSVNRPSTATGPAAVTPVGALSAAVRQKRSAAAVTKTAPRDRVIVTCERAGRVYSSIAAGE